MKTTARKTGITAAACGLLLATAAQAADYWWNGSTNNWTTQNWESPSGTPTTATPGGWDSVFNTKGGKVILTATRQPGYFRFATGELEIQTGGTLSPVGSGGGQIGGAATITVDGGTFTGIGPIGAGANGAVVNLRSGSWTKTGSDHFYARLGGRINHTGGTLTVGSGYWLILGSQENWSHSNGDLFFGDADGSAGTFTGSGGLILGNISFKMSGSGYQRTTYGTFVGHGTVGLTGTLRNNGYLIADGYGTERTLNMGSFTTVDNTVDNNEYKLSGDNNFYWGKGGTGWFAVNGGKLALPAIAVAAGPAAYNWGEKASDTDIDLVNSVRLDFADVSAGGSLSLALLATNRSEVADTRGTLVAAWEVTAPSLAFTSATTVIRYDDLRAAALGLTQANLRLYARAAKKTPWTDITASVDTAKKQITGTRPSARWANSPSGWASASSRCPAR